MTRGLVDSLAAAEKDLTAPVGWRRVTRGFVSGLANVLPEITFVACIGIVLWQLAVDMRTPSLLMILMPLYATLGVLVLLHVVVSVLLPVRWAGIRADFRRHLGDNLNDEFRSVYLPVPTDVAIDVAADRKRGEELLKEIRQVLTWVKEKERKANVGVLYGNTTV